MSIDRMAPCVALRWCMGKGFCIPPRRPLCFAQPVLPDLFDSGRGATCQDGCRGGAALAVEWMEWMKWVEWGGITFTRMAHLSTSKRVEDLPQQPHPTPLHPLRPLHPLHPLHQILFSLRLLESGRDRDAAIRWEGAGEPKGAAGAGTDCSTEVNGDVACRHSCLSRRRRSPGAARAHALLHAQHQTFRAISGSHPIIPPPHLERALPPAPWPCIGCAPCNKPSSALVLQCSSPDHLIARSPDHLITPAPPLIG